MEPSSRRPRFIGKKHFLFDLDGTLVDSTPVHARAYKKVLALHSPERLASFEYEKLSGKTTRLAFTEMGFAGDAVDALVALKQQAYLDAVANGETMMFDGTRPLLVRLHEQGLSAYLVTSASKRSTERVLASMHIHQLFRHIVTGDDVARGKPAPDGYASVVTKFGLDPSEALVIEDAEAGVIAARDAGLEVACVNMRPAPDASFTNVLATFPTLAAFHATLETEWRVWGPR